jgi:hypothetical protein
MPLPRALHQGVRCRAWSKRQNGTAGPTAARLHHAAAELQAQHLEQSADKPADPPRPAD